MINLSLTQMLWTFLLPVIVIAISYKYKLEKEKDILQASTKMTVQLLLIGYVLVFLMEKINPIIGSMYIFVMLFFATRTFKKRITNNNYAVLSSSAIKALIIASLVVLSYFILMIVNPDQIFDPQYIIPIYGMILGNTLTTITLAYNDLVKNLESERQYIETLTNLGVAPKETLRKILNGTFKVAITPVLTSLMAMGLVSLPGAMTGQILSGVSPLIAVKYQIAIMLAILGANTLVALSFILFSQQKLVNKYNQIASIDDLMKK